VQGLYTNYFDFLGSILSSCVIFCSLPCWILTRTLNGGPPWTTHTVLNLCSKTWNILQTSHWLCGAIHLEQNDPIFFQIIFEASLHSEPVSVWHYLLSCFVRRWMRIVWDISCRWRGLWITLDGRTLSQYRKWNPEGRGVANRRI